MLRRSCLTFATFALALCVGTANAQTPKSPEAPAPRTAGGHSDLTGVWEIPYVRDMGLEIGGLPFTAAGKQAYDDNLNKNIDPTSYCLFPGVPRIGHSPYPVEIFQQPDRIVILYEYMRTFRVIPTDGRPHPDDINPTLMGDSVGHWEGDTLVVDVKGFAGRTWLDSGGHPHTTDMHVVERYRRTGPQTISYEVTVNDSEYYSKPFKNTGVFKLQEPGFELLDYSCDENNKDRDNGHLQPGAK